MLNNVQLECLCGTVKGSVKIVPGSFFHVRCLCCDCQKFASHLNNEENILDEHGGTDIFQTYPDFMEITEGQEKISGVQLEKNGLFRWHTTCCNMPLANTMNSSTIPFVGVSVKLMKFASEEAKMEALGPIIMKAFGKYAIGKMPKDAYPKFPISYILKIAGFMINGLLRKKYKPSPFFKGKEPVAKINILY